MPDERAPRASDRPAPPYAWYVIGVLMALNVSSFIDRQVIALMTDTIKADLGLTDSEFSLLLGPAFGVTFALAVLVMGRLADRYSRRAIIATGVAIWSIMCTASGVANTFGQLFATRVGVGAGEATLSPSAFSLIADYFPPHQLATAMSLFTSGVFIGAGLAYLIGGLVVDLVQTMDPWVLPVFGVIRPWQTVFILLGGPGLLLALLALTIREPARTLDPSGRRIVYSAHQVRAWFRRHAVAYGTFGAGIGLFAIVNYGTAFWFPAYFERAHDWSQSKIGVFMGGATAVFGAIGAIMGGRLADRIKSRGRRDGNLVVLIVAAVISVAAAIPLFLPPSESVMIGALVVTNLVAAMPFGAAAAAAQEMSPAPMRGQASAILVFILNFIGLGLGPPAVALLTDNVFEDPAKVGLSLLTVTIVGRSLAALITWMGLSGHRRALAEVSAV
jgi:MFS family permease